MNQCLESQGRTLKEQVRLWLLEWAGERCDEFAPDCYCCEAWKSWDQMFAGVDESCGDSECLMLGCQVSSNSVRSNP